MHAQLESTCVHCEMASLVSRLKSGETRSPIQKAEVVPVLLLLITRLRQKWLARTSDVVKAASITTQCCYVHV